MIDDFGPAPYGDFDDADEEVRPGPLRRHALWVVAVTAAGVALGWWTGLFPIGPEEYGLPGVAPGPLLPYLGAWTAIGLVAASVLRAAAPGCPFTHRRRSPWPSSGWEPGSRSAGAPSCRCRP
ncbi:hypothetical protein ACISU4_10225 [Streptomyces wuyuanensis]|uniref:hypothetical protein n=1 Tax=Streptomyces wuyuanensis TaxID=1196353 RepID=UPI0037FF7C9A